MALKIKTESLLSPSIKKTESLLSPSIKSAFDKLTIAAKSLNGESDRLSKIVSDLEAPLKKLNVGLVTWVDIQPSSSSFDGTERYTNQIGYAKIGGKWCIALRSVTEFCNGADDDVEEWSFYDAPRYLRLKAVDCIPKLLVALGDEAEKFTSKITETIEVAQQLASELKGGQSQ